VNRAGPTHAKNEERIENQNPPKLPLLLRDLPCFKCFNAPTEKMFSSSCTIRLPDDRFYPLDWGLWLYPTPLPTLQRPSTPPDR
jgi:hypothetical protein